MSINVQNNGKMALHQEVCPVAEMQRHTNALQMDNTSQDVPLFKTKKKVRFSDAKPLEIVCAELTHVNTSPDVEDTDFIICRHQSMDTEQIKINLTMKDRPVEMTSLNANNRTFFHHFYEQLKFEADGELDFTLVHQFRNILFSGRDILPDEEWRRLLHSIAVQEAGIPFCYWAFFCEIVGLSYCEECHREHGAVCQECDETFWMVVLEERLLSLKKTNPQSLSNLIAKVLEHIYHKFGSRVIQIDKSERDMAIAFAETADLSIDNTETEEKDINRRCSMDSEQYSLVSDDEESSLSESSSNEEWQALRQGDFNSGNSDECIIKDAMTLRNLFSVDSSASNDYVWLSAVRETIDSRNHGWYHFLQYIHHVASNTLLLSC